MKAIARIFIVFALLVALLPAQGASAQTPTGEEECLGYAALFGATADTGEIEGAIYCILYPPGTKWNRDVVMFAHGYMDITNDISIPWTTQLITEQNNLPGLILQLGYGFAVTSYRSNGLAVLDGVQDIVNLAKHIREVNPMARRIFLTGASEGGLVTALAVERYPKVFAGALSTCGPIGSFPYQIQYWSDFRVAADGYFRTAVDQVYAGNPLAPYITPIYFPQVLLPGWDFLKLALGGQLAADPNAAAQLLASTGVPFDPANPMTIGESFLGLSYYNVFATDDARLKLVSGLTDDMLAPPSLAGNPYNNPSYTTLYPDGITPDPLALEAMKAYETSGKLSRQMVVMHTTGDPIVPFKHSLLYAKKVYKAGRLSKLTLIPIDRYGHCAFTPAEMVFGFYVMVIRSTLLPFSPAQIKAALPDVKDQMKFQELKKKNLDKMK